MNYQNEQGRIPNYYLYGTVVTRYSLASLNHGMRQGNKNLLQKPHGVTSRLKSKSRAVFPCCPILNNCQQPESLLRMNDNDNHLQRAIPSAHIS